MQLSFNPRNVVLSLLIAASLISCAHGSGTADMSPEKAKAIAIARDYVAHRMPEFSYVLADPYIAFVNDMGTTWGVGFKKRPPAPLSTGGGTPEFDIDKKSMTIVGQNLSW